MDDKNIHRPDGHLIVTIIVQRVNDLWEPLALLTYNAITHLLKYIVDYSMYTD